MPLNNGSAISGFVALTEPLLESLVDDTCPPCFAIRARPQPVASCVSICRPLPPPAAVLPHPQGLMMFGALMQPEEAPLVDVPGPIANNQAPQNVAAALAMNYHNPAVFIASIHQPDNAIAFNVIVEDIPPMELCDL